MSAGPPIETHDTPSWRRRSCRRSSPSCWMTSSMCAPAACSTASSAAPSAAPPRRPSGGRARSAPRPSASEARRPCGRCGGPMRVPLAAGAPRRVQPPTTEARSRPDPAAPPPPPFLRSACGVKRTRKLRAEAEGAKRRKLSASPAPPAHKYGGKYARQQYGAGGCLAARALGARAMVRRAGARPPTAARSPPSSAGRRPPSPRPTSHPSPSPLPAIVPHADGPDSYGSLEPDCEAWGLPAPAPGRRPQRRAAEEAAFRTARYARTGEPRTLGGMGSRPLRVALGLVRARPLAWLAHRPAAPAPSAPQASGPRATPRTRHCTRPPPPPPPATPCPPPPAPRR